MNSHFPFRLYLVLSQAQCGNRDFIALCEAAIQGGVDLVQLREKDIDSAEFLSKALRLQDMLARYNVPLIINDNLEVAQQSGAYGIHVGNSDIQPSQIRSAWKDCQSLGYSIEYKEQLSNSETAAADCLGISPVFSTTTKLNTVTEWGLKGISELRRLTDKPLIAIGGINAHNAHNAVKAGADCIAVVSAICMAQDPAKAAYEIRNQIEKA